MELPKQQETTSDAAFESEVFRVWMSLMQFRGEFQGKCIEMSLHITTGLAGAIAAAAIATIANEKFDYAKDFAKLRLPIVLVFGLYGLIQTMLLTNYIYHTYACQGIKLYNAVITFNIRRTFGSDQINKLSKDIAGLKCGWRIVFKLSYLLLGKFQPLVFYVSVAIGWFVVTWYLPQLFQTWWAYLIVGLLWLSLFVLTFLHWLTALNNNFSDYVVHRFFEGHPHQFGSPKGSREDTKRSMP